MTDKEIRRILIEYLSTTNKTYRIFQEKSIGSSICDIMLVTDKLCGFEIKSDSDNFARIKRDNQISEQPVFHEGETGCLFSHKKNGQYITNPQNEMHPRE